MPNIKKELESILGQYAIYNIMEVELFGNICLLRNIDDL